MSETIRVLDSFYAAELSCHCGKCPFDIMKFDLRALVYLQKLRNSLNSPIRILRGYSCLPHHESIYRALKQPVTLKSAHLCTAEHKCCGFDISVDRPRNEVIHTALVIGFTGIGFGDGKLHIDTMNRFAVWRYESGGSFTSVM